MRRGSTADRTRRTVVHLLGEKRFQLLVASDRCSGTPCVDERAFNYPGRVRFRFAELTSCARHQGGVLEVERATKRGFVAEQGGDGTGRCHCSAVAWWNTRRHAASG